jgi:hypothetical protein
MNDENLILLSEICVKYFSITLKIASRKSALGTLPIPAFRLTGGSRGELYVQKDALEQHVLEQIDKATKLNNRMRLAGAV